MPSRLSISSSDLIRNAALWSVLVIVIIELIFANNLHRKFFSHEVDQVLHEIEYRDFQSQVVLLGDSVGRQVTGKWHPKPRRYAALASNQAIEMFGQHHMLKRYLDNNPDPHAVVYTGLSPFGHNLRQQLTENYVQRCFTQWNEIGAMTAAKRSPVFGAKAALYRLLPSYKYRLHLQRKIAGFTNADIYSGLPRAGSSSGGQSSPGLFKVLHRKIRDQRQTDISDEYFLKTIQLCEERGIYFYYLPVPLSESRHADREKRLEELFERMRELDRTHPYFIFLKDEYRIYPDKLFADDVHVNDEGLKRVHDDTLKIFTDIVLKQRPEYEAQ